MQIYKQKAFNSMPTIVGPLKKKEMLLGSFCQHNHPKTAIKETHYDCRDYGLYTNFPVSLWSKGMGIE